MNSPAEQISDFYGTGEDLPTLHPDKQINDAEIIQQLCICLDQTRKTLADCMGLALVEPKNTVIKHKVQLTLDETHPKMLHEVHNNYG